MTIENQKYIDYLASYEITPGYRDLSLTILLKKDDSASCNKRDKVEINLSKEDVDTLLKILFKLHKEAYSGSEFPIDWDENELPSEEALAIENFEYEFGPSHIDL